MWKRFSIRQRRLSERRYRAHITNICTICFISILQTIFLKQQVNITKNASKRNSVNHCWEIWQSARTRNVLVKSICTTIKENVMKKEVSPCDMRLFMKRIYLSLVQYLNSFGRKVHSLRWMFCDGWAPKYRMSKRSLWVSVRHAERRRTASV